MLRLFRHYVPLPTLAISVVEIFFLFAAFYANYARSAGNLHSSGMSFYYAGIFAIMICMMMFSLGLYNNRGRRGGLSRRRRSHCRGGLNNRRNCRRFYDHRFAGNCRLCNGYGRWPLDRQGMAFHCR